MLCGPFHSSPFRAAANYSGVRTCLGGARADRSSANAWQLQPIGFPYDKVPYSRKLKLARPASVVRPRGEFAFVRFPSVGDFFRPTVRSSLGSTNISGKVTFSFHSNSIALARADCCELYAAACIIYRVTEVAKNKTWTIYRRAESNTYFFIRVFVEATRSGSRRSGTADLLLSQ